MHCAGVMQTDAQTVTQTDTQNKLCTPFPNNTPQEDVQPSDGVPEQPPPTLAPTYTCLTSLYLPVRAGSARHCDGVRERYTKPKPNLLETPPPTPTPTCNRKCATL